MSYQHSTLLILGLCVANSAITLTPGDDMQQDVVREYDVCSSGSSNVRLNLPGDSVIVYVHVPQGTTNTFSQSCIAEFETCESCRFKVSAVQPQFEYPECRQASWSESYCPPDCVYMILLDVDYKSKRKRVINSLAADSFETESSSLQVVACGNHNSPADVTMRLRITSVEKIQYITGNMFESTSRRTFMSPNYPNPYVRNNEYYLYTFESSSQDKFITVTFDDWILSPYSTVKFDGANIVNRINGDNHRPYIISNGKTMNMTFGTGERRRMSSDNNFIGFKGQARFYGKLQDIPHIESGCDRLLSTSEGGILHLNSAADGQNRDCIWIIKKLSGFDGVYVKIVRYKTRYQLSPSCDYSLEVREGLTSNSAQRLNLRPNDYIPNYAVQLSENGFYIRIKGCYFDDSVVLSYAMYLDDCEDYREYYKCDNGRCIADHLKCDTYDHCGDSSDETPSMCGRIPSRIRTGVGDYSSNNVSNSSSAGYDYTLGIHVIIPLVVSVILGIGILCLLILLVRRCRRLSNSVVGSRPRNSQGRRPRGRRFCWPNREVQMSVTMNSGEHPPSYEDVIRSTPIGQLNMAFSWSACESLFAQPPSYDEAISPTSRTAQASAISTHAALTNSNSSSSCLREINSNQPQFHSRPFLVATLSASLYQAADASMSSVSSEGTSDGTHRLDVMSSSENLQRENALTSADRVSDGTLISSNQNKHKQLNSEISLERNIAESGNLAGTDLGSRTCPKKKEDHLSVHSKISQRHNNKPMYNRKSIPNSDDENHYVDRTTNDTARSVMGEMSSEEGNRNRRQRKALELATDKYGTESGENAPTNDITSNDCGVYILDNDGARGRRMAQSSRSQSCADLSLDIGKSRMSVANGKKWQEDKRYSYAGMGDVSLMERGLDPICNSRDLLIATPQEYQSRQSTVSSNCQREINRNSRFNETDSLDHGPKKPNQLSNQVTELLKAKNDRQGVPTLSLNPVPENSNDEYDMKFTSLDNATRADLVLSRTTACNGSLQDMLSRNKMHPAISEQYRFETCSKGNKQIKPDVAQKLSKNSKDNSAAKHVQLSQNLMPSHNQNNLHNPGGRHNVQLPSAKDQFQNENTSQQARNNCSSSAVNDAGGDQVFPHMKSQNRNPRDSISERDQLSFGHEGGIPAADVTQRVMNSRSSRKPIPAPRIRGKNPALSDN